MFLPPYVTGKSIAISDVFQYFRSSKPNGDDGPFRQMANRPKPEYRCLFSLQAGLSHTLTDFSNFTNAMTASGVSASKADDYVGKLKNGYHVNANFHYLLTTFLGIGIDYTFTQSASEGKFLVNGYGGMNVPMYINANMNEKIYTNFAGPSILFQQFPDSEKKIKISESLSPGIVLFRDETRGNQYITYWGDNTSYSGVPPQYYDQSNAVTKGNTFGAKGGLSVEYCFTPQLSAGLAGSFTWAKLHKVSVKSLNYNSGDQKLDNALDISHIDYGFTVRYNF